MQVEQGIPRETLPAASPVPGGQEAPQTGCLPAGSLGRPSGGPHKG